jgi:hypothetical protein
MHRKPTFRLVVTVIPTLLVVVFLACSKDAVSQPPGDAAAAPTGTTHCSYGPAKRDANGAARFALLVGVGKYQSDSVDKLTGPPADVEMMHTLLTGQGGFNFPAGNVCTLLEDEATGNRFREAIEHALVRRAKRGDTVVIYFSGHGTQLTDTNGDESDRWDEVLMFVDSRTPSARDLRDDEFDVLLKPLRETTGNVIVILDSCNSGSGTRAASPMLVPRFQRPLAAELRQVEAAGPRADGSVLFAGAAPGQITIAAAADGTVALEKGSAGVFTSALVSALSQVTAQPLTYRQLARKVAPLVAATSTQVTFFDGDLDKVVFSATERTRPLAMEVLHVGTTIKLGGAILPGMGRNAELRVFDGGLVGTALNDPAKSKGMLLVESSTGLNAEAQLMSKPANAPAIEAGDFAVLVRPSDDTIALHVRIRAAGENGGVPVGQATALRAKLAAHAEASKLVLLKEQLADFEVTVDAASQFNILGPEGTIRNVMGSADSVVENLWLHARQRAFLNLRSEGGAELTDDKSLIVTIQPANRPQGSCVRRGAALGRDAAGSVIIPLCYSWQLRVKLAPDVATPLRVGGLVLSSDGSVYGFPRNGAIATLSPNGGDLVFDNIFVGGPPLGINDYLLVFGTRLENWVDWQALSATAASRDAAVPRPGQPQKGPLHRALDAYIRPAGARGQSPGNVPYEDTAWTRTAVTVRTEANPAFESGVAALNPGSREYTIKEFDIRPYLPDDKRTPLYRVLEQADALARRDLSYKQHDWSAASDEANLAKGIDCSRSTWFAFTRAQLQYNAANAYLTTADMSKTNSRMAEQFDRCPAGQPYETGDLLVYRDEGQGDGHVVMVIDAAKRIAWGSHGWDGNAKKFNVPPDTGVEYQLIKFKADWKRWDRETMTLTACWRHKEFSSTRARGLGLPGRAALGASPCSATVCNTRGAP